MSPKRRDRVPPPAKADEYELRFATSDAAKGWDELCQQAAANTRTAYDAIRATPRPAPANERHHRLKHDLAWGSHNGITPEQWQYEVTSGGRIWYLVDDKTRTAWITYASTRHPKATDKR